MSSARAISALICCTTRDPTGRYRERHGREAPPASRFSPAAYEKMRFDSARIEQISNGLTILQGLQPAGLGHWNSGSLYNPDDGLTYRVSAELHSADRFLARVYLGVPLLGETKTPAAGSAPQVGRLELASLRREP